jgi:hypothetical protein
MDGPAAAAAGPDDEDAPRALIPIGRAFLNTALLADGRTHEFRLKLIEDTGMTDSEHSSLLKELEAEEAAATPSATPTPLADSGAAAEAGVATPYGDQDELDDLDSEGGMDGSGFKSARHLTARLSRAQSAASGGADAAASVADCDALGADASVIRHSQSAGARAGAGVGAASSGSGRAMLPPPRVRAARIGLNLDSALEPGEETPAVSVVAHEGDSRLLQAAPPAGAAAVAGAGAPQGHVTGELVLRAMFQPKAKVERWFFHALVGEFDTDGDGKLSYAEVRAVIVGPSYFLCEVRVGCPHVSSVTHWHMARNACRLRNRSDVSRGARCRWRPCSRRWHQTWAWRRWRSCSRGWTRTATAPWTSPSCCSGCARRSSRCVA